MDIKKIFFVILLLIALIFIIPNNILIAILIFGIIVMIHELGHFIVARKSGIFVEEFAIGMGPKLISFKKKDTVYSIRILPIGGFCKMLGEDEDVEDKRAFNRKSVWARMATIAAGPIFNFILAFVCAVFVVSYLGYTPTKVDNVTPNMPAEGKLVEGDTIIRVDGRKPYSYREIQVYTQFSKGEPIDITVKRDNKKERYTIKPQVELPFILPKNIIFEDVDSNLSDKIQIGDRILEIDEKIITSKNQIANLEEKDSYEVLLERDGNDNTILIDISSKEMALIPYLVSEVESLEIRALDSTLDNKLYLGDKILKINEEDAISQEQIREYVEENSKRLNSFDLLIKREGIDEPSLITLTTEQMIYSYRMGIGTDVVKGNFITNIKQGFNQTISWVKITLFSFEQLVTGNVSVKQLAGPVGLVNFISEGYEQEVQRGFMDVMAYLANMILLLSVNLGVFNLLPVPALDGSRLVFLIIEAVRGKPIDREKEGLIHFVGLVLLMLLMIFVLFNDIQNIFG